MNSSPSDDDETVVKSTDPLSARNGLLVLEPSGSQDRLHHHYRRQELLQMHGQAPPESSIQQPNKGTERSYTAKTIKAQHTKGIIMTRIGEKNGPGE